MDSTDRARLADTSAELNELLLEERLAGASLLVLANKQDLIGALSPEAIEEALDLRSQSAARKWRVMACSAISGLNVTEGLDWVVDEVASRLYLFE